MDEFHISNELAELMARISIESLREALQKDVNKLFQGEKEI